MKVLVVDDDVDLLDLMTYALRREGYDVSPPSTGSRPCSRWETEHPDIVLLDGNLPKIDGFEVCRRIRHESTTPVIMLTARDEEDDILRGLQIGADDYMTKPFSAKQLAARMKAVLRRCQSDPYREPASQVQVGDLVLDLQSHEVTKDGEPIQLTRLEFRILYMLALNEGRIIPYSRPDRVRLGLLRRGQLEPAEDPHLPHPQEGRATAGRQARHQGRARRRLQPVARLIPQT